MGYSMLRKKKSKRGIINEDIPHVSKTNARRQVLCGGIGFLIGLVLVVSFRPGSVYLLEMFVVIGVVASCTLGGMKFAQWIYQKFEQFKE